VCFGALHFFLSLGATLRCLLQWHGRAAMVMSERGHGDVGETPSEERVGHTRYHRHVGEPMPNTSICAITDLKLALHWYLTIGFSDIYPYVLRLSSRGSTWPRAS
jgi:hypothetical protein